MVLEVNYILFTVMYRDKLHGGFKASLASLSPLLWKLHTHTHFAFQISWNQKQSFIEVSFSLCIIGLLLLHRNWLSALSQSTDRNR